MPHDNNITFGDLTPEGLTNVRTIKQSDIMKCPFLIMVPSHYRADATCRCDDPAERERMTREWEYTDDDFRRAGLIP